MNGSRVDRAALVWGAVFTLIGTAFLGQEWGWWQVRAGILMPVLLIVAGTVILLAALVLRDTSV